MVYKVHECGGETRKNDEVYVMIRCSIDSTYLRMPLIYIRDKCTGTIRAVGTNQHDRLYLDSKGHIQYINIQSMSGTGDAYEFVADESGYGTTDWDIAYFDSVDLKQYTNDTYVKRLKELFNDNLKLVFELDKLEKEKFKVK